MKEEQLIEELIGEDASAPEISLEELSRFLAGEMDAAEREEFEAYMAACPEVRQWVKIVLHERELEQQEALRAVEAASTVVTAPNPSYRKYWLQWLPLGATGVLACGLLVTFALLNNSSSQIESLQSSLFRRDAENVDHDNRIAQLQNDISKSKQDRQDLEGRLRQAQQETRKALAKAASTEGSESERRPGRVLDDKQPSILQRLQSLGTLLAVGTVRGGGNQKSLPIATGSAHGSYVAPGELEFSWSEHSGTDSWHLFIVDKKTGQAVWPAPGTPPELLTNRRARIPKSLLEPGRAYDWSVVDALKPEDSGPTWSFAVVDAATWAAVRQKVSRAPSDEAKVEIYISYLLLDEASALIKGSKSLREDARNRLVRFIESLRQSVIPR